VDPQNPRLSTEVPYFLHNVVSCVTGGQDLLSIISKDGKHGVTYSKMQLTLYFSSEAITSLCEGSVSGIVKLLKTLLKRKRLANVSTVLMVGGYSECKILQEKVKEAVKKRCQDKVRVIVPENSSLCVIEAL
jgi:molecular chaperone DnaK (HSP70)